MADAVSAIAGAIGDISNTVTAFVQKGAQQYGFQKSLEVGGVEFERSKTLSLYEMALVGKKSEANILMVGVGCLLLLVAINKYMSK